MPAAQQPIRPTSTPWRLLLLHRTCSQREAAFRLGAAIDFMHIWKQAPLDLLERVISTAAYMKKVGSFDGRG